MKVLIMVLSCQDSPFDEIRKGQMETWDSIHHPDVETIYYFGNGNNKMNGKNLSLNVSDRYYEMHWKFKLALDYVWDMDWDYIFRTNTSTYVNKERLYNYIKKNTPDYSGNSNGSYLTGNAIILSRKSALILKDNLVEVTKNQFPDEDIVIGDTLKASNILPVHEELLSLYNFKLNTFEEGCCCYRCKGDNRPSDDIKAFKNILNKDQ